MASSTAAYSGSIPANYDQYLGPYLFEPYAIDIAERVKKHRPKKVLELACGTGRVTNHLIKQLPGNVVLVATDINPDMLKTAQSIVGNNAVEWQLADAQELQFADETFDVVVCQFGVMFLPDKQRAFEGINRVLKYGGSFIFNTWAELNKNPRVALIVEVLTDLFGQDAPDFLEKGPYSFYDTLTIETMLKKADFLRISISEVARLSTYQNVEDIVKGFVEGTPLYSFLQQYPSQIQEKTVEKLRQELSAISSRQLAYPMSALVCEAIKE